MTTPAWVGTWRPHRPRGLISAQFPSPGPQYSIPGTTGYVGHSPTKARAPAYTFRGTKPPAAGSCGPGPFYTSASPCYSVRGRSQRGRFDEDLAKVTLIKPQAPASTFGIRHSLYTTPLIVE
uniref:ODF3A protein n=1 Tax=Gallus gallus TaxID=9031 RepID=A0A8V1AM96_CHICK